MNVSNIYSIVLFSLLFVHYLSYAASDDDESIVPEDIEDGSILDEDEAPAQEASKLLPSAIEEYMKEHPEVKQMPTTAANGEPFQMKRVYNKFGDVVSIPDTSANKIKDTQKPLQNSQMPQKIAPNPYPYFNPYAMNPYFNPQFGIQGQQQGFVQIPRPPQQSPPPGSPVTPQEMTKYELKPRTGSEDQTKSETEVNDKIYQMMQNQRMAQQMPTNINATIIRPFPPFAPFPPMHPLPPMMPSFPPFQTMYNPNQYQVDNKNIKVIPLPNNINAIDPNLLRKLESGRAQLDMAHARIIPMEIGPTTQEPVPLTESDSLDDRPELPEVVLPKPAPTTKPSPKRRPKGRRTHRRHSKNRHEARKPHFLMRARLNKLPKKGQKGGDEWWTKPVPEYCSEPIIDITTCSNKDKDLEKRWSFNTEDEKCYLYEDLCYRVKKNTFKSLKDCMTACWRPK